MPGPGYNGKIATLDLSPATVTIDELSDDQGVPLPETLIDHHLDAFVG